MSRLKHNEISEDHILKQIKTVRDQRTDAMNMVNDLQSALDIAKEALEAWILWEREQIKKDGPYVGAKINELINNGESALKTIAEMENVKC